MKTYSFWKVVGTLVALKVAVDFTEGLVKGFSYGLYRSGAFENFFDKAEQRGYDFGKFAEDKPDREPKKDKIVGFHVSD